MITEQPPVALAQWNPIVLTKAQEFQLDAYIVAADIWTESSGLPYASRFEPSFVWFYDLLQGPLHDKNLSARRNRKEALRILGEEEFHFQSTSHGLLQIMGSVARELGYRGGEEEFYDPTTNVHFGCKHHAGCLRRARGDLHKALLFYNGGGNPSYPDMVISRASILRSL